MDEAAHTISPSKSSSNFNASNSDPTSFVVNESETRFASGMHMERDRSDLSRSIRHKEIFEPQPGNFGPMDCAPIPFSGRLRVFPRDAEVTVWRSHMTLAPVMSPWRTCALFQCHIKVLARGRRPLLLPLTTLLYFSRYGLEGRYMVMAAKSGNSEVSICASINFFIATRYVDLWNELLQERT